MKARRRRRADSLKWYLELEEDVVGRHDDDRTAFKVLEYEPGEKVVDMIPF